MMLIGIVKKNAIMMIDFALQRKRSGDIIRTRPGDLRGRDDPLPPIMMTTMAAMMGTASDCAGHPAWARISRRPLGLCVAGGLLLFAFADALHHAGNLCVSR